MIASAGLLFIPPIVISFFAYTKYCFDNVVPVIYRRSKRYLDSEAMKNVIAAENKIPTSQRDSILFNMNHTKRIKNRKKTKNAKNASKRDRIRDLNGYKKKKTTDIKKKSYMIAKNFEKKE